MDSQYYYYYAVGEVMKERWTPYKKAEVIRKVGQGEISFDSALEIYELSEEELNSWFDRVSVMGLSGLKETKLEQYRRIKW